ncbi:hypothetical protein [Legionella sp. 16cNR16C]|uniref:hypothetical protein n=1 Tax=Legionella sp. 16cNR16C TaxID=2905656 RepID=UPI001E44BC9E|nr:hypothetical protein [Legionella sp. 16cNR16C]MCE3045767.1 hypothetical protein [Legionella sp. 16cNR16C]
MQEKIDNSLALIKSKTKARNDASVLTLQLHDSQIQDLIDTSFSLVRMIGEGEILLMPGRSPALHAFILKAAGHPCFHFPCSGRFYAFNSYPENNQLEGMRANLERIGLNIELLQTTKKIHLFDYIDSGACIEGLLMLFAHWAYDIKYNNGRASSAKMFHDIAYSSEEYKHFLAKFSVHAMGKLSLYMFPHLKTIQKHSFNKYGHLSMPYFANAIYARTIYFPRECWHLDATKIHIEDLNPEFAKEVRIQEISILEKLLEHSLAGHYNLAGLERTFEAAITNLKITEIASSYNRYRFLSAAISPRPTYSMRIQILEELIPLEEVQNCALQ